MADHKEKPELESVMDKISEKKKGSSSTAAAEAMKTKIFYGLFGREKSVGSLPSASLSPHRGGPAANNSSSKATVELDDLAIMGCSTTNVNNESGGSGIPLVVDLKMLTGPERRMVVEAIGRDGNFFMVTNDQGIPAGVVEGMPESERLKCYSDDPNNKVAEARALALRLLEALSESLGLERSRMVAAMGRHAQHMAAPCPPPELTTYGYGLPEHKDPTAITLLLQDQQQQHGVSGQQVAQRGGRWVAVNPVPDALVINIVDLLQAIRLSSTSINVPNPLESFVDQWPSNPPSSFRAVCNVLEENITSAMHKLGCSSPSYCLPITANDPLPHGPTPTSPFSPLFILEKNDIKVDVNTNEATTNEDVSKFDLATIAGTLSLLVPVAINIDELTITWGPMLKVFCGIFMIMSLMSALIGLFTASFRAESRARNLSSRCARMSLLVSTIVFMLLIASKLGSVGCVAGVTLVLVMLILTVLWIRSEEPTSDRVVHEI